MGGERGGGWGHASDELRLVMKLNAETPSSVALSYFSPTALRTGRELKYALLRESNIISKVVTHRRMYGYILHAGSVHHIKDAWLPA